MRPNTERYIESTKNLDALFVSVLEEFRQRYLVSYSPKGGLTPGWHKLEVRVKGRKGLTIKARGASTLTVQAPPDGFVAPPGYYMLFLLLDGVPSVSSFVRVG